MILYKKKNLIERKVIMIFGLDVGVASLGWAVIGEDYKVIEAGVNSFKSADASMNVERRGFRQLRRLHRRKKNRINDFNNLWVKTGMGIPSQKCNNQIELRVKGLKDKLTEEEIYFVLVNMLKHRGISYLEDAVDESNKNESKYEKGINENQKLLQEGKFPCEIQLSRLEKHGQYRGEIVEDDIILGNVFTTKAYREEVVALLKNQTKSHQFITDEFKSAYLNIFNRKRKYYEGPGNELSRTDYGIYTTVIDESTGEYKTEDNIFDKLIGKCSVYKNLRRAAGASYTSQEFNLLNDLNNLTVNGRKLEEVEKHRIVEIIKTSNTVNMKNIIKKVINENINTLSGARIDKDGKEIFHKFEQYNKIRKELEKIGGDITNFSREDLDEIGEILTLNTEKEAILSALRKIPCNDQEKECFFNLRRSNPGMFNKWQSFSLELMNELIPEMYLQSKNQMQLLTDMGVFKLSSDRYNGYKYIPKEVVTQEIYNPVVKRSIRITIDVMNALIKKYGYPEKIVIEMPRDKNSDDEKNRIKEEQKKNEREITEVLEKIKNEYGIVITDEHRKRQNQLNLKLKLWNEQDGRCLYSGKEIDINDLLYDPSKFEIDHIIPRSISFDDSRSNKVLVYYTENKKKGNLTPYMYLISQNRDWDWHKYMNKVLELKANAKISKSKVDKLLFTDEITKIDVLKGFVSRNINDTRYASKVILNALQSFMQSKNVDTKVATIKGSFTHQMRKVLRLEKNRNESFAHHAIDAMLICYSQMGFDTYRKLQETFIDFDNEDITDKNLWDRYMDDRVCEEYLYNKKWRMIKENIQNAEKNIKYWYKVDSKVNRGLCNQTIVGTREINGEIYKINKLSLYTPDGYNRFKKIIDSGKEKDFLMYNNDRRTFNDILKIYRQYNDSTNAFMQYYNETGDFVRKYAKNHNGCRIENLKYYEKKIESCIDISHKYGHDVGSKKVVLLGLNPYRMDVYYNTNNNKYYFVGVKFSDLRFQGGTYLVDKDMYSQALINEKMLQPGEDISMLQSKGYEFRLTFYKNEIIKYEKKGEMFIERFLSRTSQDSNGIETKPINAEKFKNKDRNIVKLAKTKFVSKIRTDILGNQYECLKEEFKRRI